MKTIHGFFVLSIVVAAVLAAPDWDAIKAKYGEIEQNWSDHSQKALDVVREEADSETLKQAEQALNSFVTKGKTFYRSTVYKAINDQSLTPQKVEEFRDKLTYQADLAHEQFKPIKQNLSEGNKKKLDELYEASKEFRYSKVKEVVEMLIEL